MQSKSIKTMILSIVFLMFLFCGFIKNGSYLTIDNIFTALTQEDETDMVKNIEDDYISHLWLKGNLIDLNGIMARILDIQGYYSNLGMYLTDNKYIVSSAKYTSTNYEYEQTVAFNDYLEANGINFLYVNEPTKYIDDTLFREEFGVESYSNQNMDLFLKRINSAGVNTIDLRDNIKSENINIENLFYRTDHHWTVPAGLWASKIIAEGLNDYCGYSIDTSIYNEENYNYTEYDQCWIGEQGAKFAKTHVGLSDYTEVKPKFQTSFMFKNGDGTETEGTFDRFVDESVYNAEKDDSKTASWHYTYHRINAINNNVDYGKVLLIGDSYDHVTQPFLSLGIKEVDSLILRNYDDSFNLRNYIVEQGYDTVIVAYAQFMLGAHDDESSANYRMYSFE